MHPSDLVYTWLCFCTAFSGRGRERSTQFYDVIFESYFMTRTLIYFIVL
jgi:hypothetical protein